LCHVTLKLAVSRSRPPVPYWTNLFIQLLYAVKKTQTCISFSKWTPVQICYAVEML